jgi:hypothetical protein
MIVISFLMEVVFGIALVPWALVSRLLSKRCDIGIGPLPLINNVYHKEAMHRYGYQCETFAYNPYYITREFDRVDDWSRCPRVLRRLRLIRFAFAYLFRYRCLYLYFNGHILGLSTRWLWCIEPWLLKLANVRTVILGYGGDVQDLRRSANLLLRHGMNVDYPRFYKSYDRIAAMVKLWSARADHVTAGCDWVDYQTRWDTLLLAHFSIDVDRVRRDVADSLAQYEQIRHSAKRPMRVVHACNHRALKGTEVLRKAVGNLRKQGYDIELVEFFRNDHQEVLREMAMADVVADQFAVGWYAMFTLEALSLGKPVLCYLREDLIKLYTYAGLIDANEIPIINTEFTMIEQRLRELYDDRSRLDAAGAAGVEFVRRRHSTQAIGSVFDRINRSLGISPRLPVAKPQPENAQA